MKRILLAALTLGAVFTVSFFITNNPVVSAFISGAVTCFVMSYQIAPAGALGTYVGASPMEKGSIQVISSERERAIYEHNKNDQRFAGKPMTQGFLRLESTITANKNILNFKLFDGDGTTVYPTERRLDRNDAFIINELGMFLLKQDVANGKTNGILLSYPNITVFTAGPAADLHSIYAGELRFTIGRVKKLVALDTRRFLCIPQTQQSGGGNYDQIKRDMGFIHLTPQIVLDGSGTNEIEIQYPTFAGWAGQSAVNGTEHRVVLYMRGLLVSGGSQITGGSQNE